MAETIAAIATGGGVSAIGIIRLSGDGAIEAVRGVFRPKGGLPIDRRPDRTLVYGSLLDAEGRLIDDCLCTVSHAPNSYTGEDTAELQCHGSPTVLSEGLRALFARGARMARRGEFTQRAFLNGRMDLTQAEAVVDLIDSMTPEAARNAAGQLSGAMGREFSGIYDSLKDMAARFQAVVDYPDEDVGELEQDELKAVIGGGERRLASLIKSYENRGRILNGGVPAAILGRPNAGKSSLLNALLGYERAIVTPVAGTTRDTIEESVRLGGVLLRLADTAGIRETGDQIERMGVDRALAAAKGAELAICVIDGAQPLEREDVRSIEAALEAPRRVAVINKSDLPLLEETIAETRRLFGAEPVVLSAAAGTGLDALESAVAAQFPEGGEYSCGGEVLSNLRQYQAACRARDALERAGLALDGGVTPDAVLCDAEEAMEALGEITGVSLREDITARIFERFCVGK